jgi:hypothetical protein
MSNAISHTSLPAPDRPVVKRDLRRERQFLTATSARNPSFIAHAEQRLSVGQQQFGDSWSWAGIPRLLAEMREEAVDIATWADSHRPGDRPRPRPIGVASRAAPRGACDRGTVRSRTTRCSNARRAIHRTAQGPRSWLRRRGRISRAS